jgi:hypothetical protein
VLRDLLLAENARVVIEIGLAYGSSALTIAEALVSGERGAIHLIIDAFQDQFHDAGWTRWSPPDSPASARWCENDRNSLYPGS